MTRLIIQIPSYNEEGSLPITLASLPRSLPGVDSIEWLIVDDGSADRTSQVAREHGADHVVRLARHRGLAHAFVAGLEASLRAGADIIVNTDADNQYSADDIGELIAPILRGEAEIVVGARPISATPHFSSLKKILQKVGSLVVRKLSQTDIPDAPSGFRAMTREAARRLKVFNEYSYTLETIIQAGQKGMAITSVPVRTNPDLRPSRLVGSVGSYVRRQLLVLVRIFMTYRPFFFFATPGAVSFALGFIIGLRFVFHYVTAGGAGQIQSLILAALLMGSGLALIVVGLVADLIAVNRKLLEGIDWRLQHVEERLGDRADDSEKLPMREPARDDPGQRH